MGWTCLKLAQCYIENGRKAKASTVLYGEPDPQSHASAMNPDANAKKPRRHDAGAERES
jgi:hypothetical protein